MLHRKIQISEFYSRVIDFPIPSNLTSWKKEDIYFKVIIMLVKVPVHFTEKAIQKTPLYEEQCVTAL